MKNIAVITHSLGQPQPRLHMDSPDIPVLHQRGQFVGVSCASISLQHVCVIVNWSPSNLIAMLWFPEYKTLGYQLRITMAVTSQL